MAENGIAQGRLFSSSTLTLVAILSAVVGILVGAIGVHVNLLERVSVLEVEVNQLVKSHGG